jgi:hypothetical protein
VQELTASLVGEQPRDALPSDLEQVVDVERPHMDTLIPNEASNEPSGLRSMVVHVARSVQHQALVSESTSNYGRERRYIDPLGSARVRLQPRDDRIGPWR